MEFIEQAAIILKYYIANWSKSSLKQTRLTNKKNVNGDEYSPAMTEHDPQQATFLDNHVLSSVLFQIKYWICYSVWLDYTFGFCSFQLIWNRVIANFVRNHYNFIYCLLSVQTSSVKLEWHETACTVHLLLPVLLSMTDRKWWRMATLNITWYPILKTQGDTLRSIVTES